MKLEKIKLSGFKSFVDPTTIPINSNLTAIVGPNGCGKSNIIDAVRWVMGESSAKHLRGGNMADVIFNGSSGRKPVSTASVELVFDNSEGRAGGEFAKYNTLSIKRQVSRDGQSLYMLNGARCRRKDITDLFLGTGLGSRSYAIIEQGTISRMVEAKPDELRVHIEEAAGISKYKERRHETETRMRHTRENLERLDDLREEVSKQLSHLKKQAEKAEQYTELKKQERRFREEHLAMRWSSYQAAAEKLEDKLQEIAEEHNRLFMLLRETDKDLETHRNLQKSKQQQLDELQGKYYHLVSEISALEQTITHQEQSHEETLIEIKRLKQQYQQTSEEYEQDSEQLEAIRQELMEAEEALYVAKEQAEETEFQRQESLQQKNDWQKEWEAFLSEQAKYKEQYEVQRTKLNQLEIQKNQLQLRAEKLQSEKSQLADAGIETGIESLESAIELIESEKQILQQQLEQQHQQIGEQRQQLRQLQDQQHQYRTELHHVQGKISSLELLQKHAMGKDKKDLLPWLKQYDLDGKPRLAEFLNVADGWETAVERMLGHYLEAVCIDNYSDWVTALETLDKQSLILFETETVSGSHSPDSLLAKIESQWNLAPILSGIFCAESLAEAVQKREQLEDWQSIVLADGTWLGKNWIKVSRDQGSQTGVLQREKELRQLKQREDELKQILEDTEETLEQLEQSLKDLEAQREHTQQQERSLTSELSAKASELSGLLARNEQQQRRLSQIDSEIAEIMEELSNANESILEAEQSQQQALEQIEALELKKETLEEQSQQLQELQYSSDQLLNEARKQLHTLEARIQSLKSTELLTQRQLERLQLQNQQTTERIAELEEKLNSTLTPMDDEKIRLQQLKQEKLQFEEQLKRLREDLQTTEQTITELSERHQQTQRQMETQKEKLDQVRFEQQDSLVRQQTINEQLQEMNADAEQIIKNLPQEAEETLWKNRLDDIVKKIQRLGTINLTAIEEYKSQSERMNFLNEQHDDLTDALNTLDQAINKIDKESRQRFKETFDKINQGLQDKFPKLFGGGQAYLELTDDDLLEAGVNIIARPPGKRNSSIHLLSGGEKALTAVALVFSIFDLNPAPFCLLDEVDAPLDDANVVRFSKMVEDMAESVQFLYISHNKVTMEIAKHLAGVTMKEPGVSRMVAVDIEEAVTMAEA